MSGRSTITMKKVAEQAGVSMMTVSLALRSDAASSRISPETRQRVLDAANVLRYRPNARGRALRSGYTNVIGLYAGWGFVNVRLPFFTEIVSGLQEGCEQFKKDLLLHGTFHGSTSEDIFTELADGRIDGLVVQMPASDPLAARLIDSSLPVVALADVLPGIPSIVVDDADGSRRISQHLREKGYRHFVYLGCGLPIASSVRRRDAFLASAAANGLQGTEMRAPEESAAWTDWLREKVRDRPDERPTAVVCWNDKTAYDLLASCRRLGIRVPEEIAVVGFDGCPTPYDGVWSLTTVRAPWAVAARTAVAHLDRILNEEDVPAETVLPVEIVVGHTT